MPSLLSLAASYSHKYLSCWSSGKYKRYQINCFPSLAGEKNPYSWYLPSKQVGAEEDFVELRRWLTQEQLPWQVGCRHYIWVNWWKDFLSLGLWPVRLSTGSVRNSFYYAGMVACWNVFKVFWFCKSVKVSFSKDHFCFLGGITWVLVNICVKFNQFILTS